MRTRLKSKLTGLRRLQWSTRIPICNGLMVAADVQRAMDELHNALVTVHEYDRGPGSIPATISLEPGEPGENHAVLMARFCTRWGFDVKVAKVDPRFVRCETGNEYDDLKVGPEIAPPVPSTGANIKATDEPPPPNPPDLKLAPAGQPAAPVKTKGAYFPKEPPKS